MSGWLVQTVSISLIQVVFGHLKKEEKKEKILVCVEFLYMLCL